MPAPPAAVLSAANTSYIAVPGPRGGVVTQRTANPRTPVQFRAWPPTFCFENVRRGRMTTFGACTALRSALQAAMALL